VEREELVECVSQCGSRSETSPDATHSLASRLWPTDLDHPGPSESVHQPIQSVHSESVPMQVSEQVLLVSERFVRTDDESACFGSETRVLERVEGGASEERESVRCGGGDVLVDDGRWSEDDLIGAFVAALLWEETGVVSVDVRRTKYESRATLAPHRVEGSTKRFLPASLLQAYEDASYVRSRCRHHETEMMQTTTGCIRTRERMSPRRS
jgi:hypothetical protein